MVNRLDTELNVVFSALSDPTRRAILARLAEGELTVSALAAPFGITLPAVSKHVRVLEQAGLLKRRKLGRTHRCSLEPAPLRAAADWLGRYREFWEQRLSRLGDYLDGVRE